MNNDNREVLEAISALSSHVDTQINEVRDDMVKLKTGLQGEMGKLKTDLQEDMSKLKTDLQADMGKLRSDLIDHVTKTVSNVSIAVKDARVDRTVYKLKEKNIFSPADVLEVLTPALQA